MITSLRNPEVVAVVRLHRRRGRADAGQTLLEGPVLIGEAVANGFPIAAIYGLEDDEVGASLGGAASIEYTAVSPEVLAKLSTTEEAQSPVAVIAIPAPSAIPAGRLIVAWGVGDPGNCGSLIRTAAAFSYGFVAGPGAADPWSPKVLRAGAGGQFRTTLAQADHLDEVRSRGRVVVATVVQGGVAPGPLPVDAAILVGSEPHGLPADIVNAADIRVTIPMASGAESLNAAVAGAIVAFLGGSGPSPGGTI
ncbi:MAG: RNA methyltransferase [Acidimicrobiia bacterium]